MAASLRAIALSLLGFALTQPSAQEKPPLPKILVAFPIGVEPGKKTSLTLRGLQLAELKAVQLEPAGASVVIESNGTAAVPNNTSKDTVGDTQVRLAITLPKEFAGEKLLLRVQSAGGLSEALTLPVLREGAFSAEKEDNNGFRTPQTLAALPTRVVGSIRGAQDVDVYMVKGRAGQTLSAEVFAHRGGSLCDAVLTVRDARLTLLASDDDSAGGRDPRVAIRLPADGNYFVVVQDAHDTGGEMHPYHLLVR